MFEKLNKINRKPKLYEKGSATIWESSHLAKGMLAAHLNPDVDSATRSYDFVVKSVNWIANILPSSENNRILDLGCGPGVYAELFCEKGYSVIGVDISSNSIAYAKENAKLKQLDIEYDVKNYIEDALPNNVDVVTLIYCDFGVLSKTDRMILLTKIYQGLNDGGHLIFDVFSENKYRGKSELKDWFVEKDGFWSKKESLILHSFYQYKIDNTYLNQYIVIEENNIEYYNIWEHVFCVDELKDLLCSLGFKDITFYSNVLGEEYYENSNTICVVVKK